MGVRYQVHPGRAVRAEVVVRAQCEVGYEGLYAGREWKCLTVDALLLESVVEPEVCD